MPLLIPTSLPEFQRDFLPDVDRGLLGLDEEDAAAADAETVVGGLDDTAHPDRIFVDNVLVALRVPLAVVDVPAE